MTLTNKKINDLMHSKSDNERMLIIADSILNIRFLSVTGHEIRSFISYLFRTMQYTGIDYSNSITMLKAEFPNLYDTFKQWNS